MDPTASSPRSPPRQRSTRLRLERRIIGFGFFASVLLHLLLIVLFPSVSHLLDPLPSAGNRQAPVEQEFGVEIVALAEIEDEEGGVARPDDPLPAVLTVVPSAPAGPALIEMEGEEPEEALEVDTLPSVAERLRPQMVDPRLWAPVELLGVELTDIERAELLLGGMIRSWNDSVAIELALSERATDWTYTDDQGRRWGLSPGRLHLGDFSIPLPFSFRSSAEGSMLRRRELEDLEWIRQDLQRARIQGEIREVWVERARAIRERMEAERLEGAQGGGDAP